MTTRGDYPTGTTQHAHDARYCPPRRLDADGDVADDLAVERRAIYRREFADAICGRGSFFSDCADECLDALIRAYSLVGVTREQRAAYLDGCIAAIAHDYADKIARGAQ